MGNKNFCDVVNIKMIQFNTQIYKVYRKKISNKKTFMPSFKI